MMISGRLFWGTVSALLLASALGPSSTFAQDVQNQTYQQQGKTIVLTYDLMAEEGEEYKVNLLLSADGGNTFDYEPQAVSGDVGEGVTPGPSKRIVWTVLEDKPAGLQGGDFQFKITVDEEGNGWLWVLGSAVLAGGGGTAAAILTGLFGDGSGGGGSGENGSGSSGIPPAPSPPN